MMSNTFCQLEFTQPSQNDEWMIQLLGMSSDGALSSNRFPPCPRNPGSDFSGADSITRSSLPSTVPSRNMDQDQPQLESGCIPVSGCAVPDSPTQASSNLLAVAVDSVHPDVAVTLIPINNPPPGPPPSDSSSPRGSPTPPSGPPPPNSPPAPRGDGDTSLPSNDNQPLHIADNVIPLHQRKAMCILRRPLLMPAEDFVNKFKISKDQFIAWIQSCADIVSRTKELDYSAQGLLFLHRMLNNASTRELTVDFILSERAVRKIFWNVAMHQYKNNINVPRLIFNGNTVDSQVNHLLSNSFDATPPLIRNIFRYFEDPSGRSRLPVVLLLDATYLSVQDSSDISLHKTLFYGPKRDHIVKLICITNTNAKIVGVLPLASSQSPSCGDSFLVGHFIQLEESSGSAQYFRTLIRGNDTYFVVLVTDAGLVTRPARSGVVVPGLDDICLQENCILLHTKKGDYLLERDERSGKICKITSSPDAKSRPSHTMVISRLVRNINEQAHGGLKQKVLILGDKKLPRQFLLPIGLRFGSKYQLPVEDHNLPRLSILVTLGVSLYNQIHAGFQLRYIDRYSQIALAQIYCSRINLENPFDHSVTWNNSLETNRMRGYQVIRIGDLQERNNIGFPKLPQELFNPLVYDLTGGPGPILGASAILSYMSFRWIKENSPHLSVSEIQQAIGLPLDCSIQYFVQDVEPEGWDVGLFGNFVPCTIVRMLCPPSHNSDSDISKWKYAVVCFSETHSSRLNIRGPLSQVMYWTCVRCPSDMGLMRTCKHVAALLMVLGFPYAFSVKTLAVSLLNPKAAEGTQTTRILPDSSSGGWSDTSLGSNRLGRDTRRNNILYPPSCTMILNVSSSTMTDSLAPVDTRMVPSSQVTVTTNNNRARRPQFQTPYSVNRPMSDQNIGNGLPVVNVTEISLLEVRPGSVRTTSASLPILSTSRGRQAFLTIVTSLV